MNIPLQVAIQGIGIIGPGLDGWDQASPIFRGEKPYEATPLPSLKPELLPANERRRTTQLIKLAIKVAEDAQRHSGIAAESLASVFSSAEGDTFIVDRLCEALSLPEKPVSPTQFHNSVHNAAAGYWAIADKSQRFSTSIAAAGASFAAGLMEAMVFVVTEEAPVLLVSYDVALPAPLAPFGDCHTPFAVALVLVPDNQGPGIATLKLSPPQTGDVSNVLPKDFARLRRDNPAAESLVLLERLAQGKSDTVKLAYLDGRVLPVTLVC